MMPQMGQTSTAQMGQQQGVNQATRMGMVVSIIIQWSFRFAKYSGGPILLVWWVLEYAKCGKSKSDGWNAQCESGWTAYGQPSAEYGKDVSCECIIKLDWINFGGYVWDFAWNFYRETA